MDIVLGVIAGGIIVWLVMDRLAEKKLAELEKFKNESKKREKDAVSKAVKEAVKDANDSREMYERWYGEERNKRIALEAYMRDPLDIDNVKNALEARKEKTKVKK